MLTTQLVEKMLDVRYWILGLLFLSLCSLLIAHSSPLLAQSREEEIRDAIEKVDKGQSEEVRKILPDLVSKYQNEPGILYLQGRLATDGIEAVKFYQGTVDNFSKSEWADDALYRIHQYYYSLGLYRTADLKMQQLKKEYPNSPYVTGKPEPIIPPQEEMPVKLPEKEVITTETQEIPQTIEPPPSKQPTQTPTLPVSVSEPYTVQVGAYSTIVNAEKQKKYFDDLGYKVEITNKIRNGRNMYLVWVGSFSTIEEARDMVKEIKKKYKLDSMIVERY
ncbi:MAG: SPOR domain-containing protein [Bacteroidota bacterium]|nr:SPOR domain-containing protein [Bacteroidota bacterium]